MGGSTSRSGRQRIDEQLINKLWNECLEKVNELDESMVGFLKGLDILTATLRMVTDYRSTTTTTYDKSMPSETNMQNDSERKRLTKDVLVRIEESFLDPKKKTLQNLRQLLRFIVETAKSHSTVKVEELQWNKYKEDASFNKSFIDSFRQTQENEIKTLQENQELLKRRLEISKRTENNFVKEKKEILAENKILNNLYEQKTNENEQLQNKICSLENDMEDLKTKYVEDWKSEKESLLKEKDDKIESLKIDINDLKKQIETLRENVETEKRTKEKLKIEYEKIKEELESIMNKKVVQVQLFYHRRGGLIAEVEENLKEVLKTRMEDRKTELKFICCNSTSEISPDLPTLLIAICASRLGTDAANALQGLDLHKKIVLLIFHHKDVHALPSQASERVLTGLEFKSIGGIYDMAFLSQKGIYSCDMNETSITTVLSFLNSMKT